MIFLVAFVALLLRSDEEEPPEIDICDAEPADAPGSPQVGEAPWDPFILPYRGAPVLDADGLLTGTPVEIPDTLTSRSRVYRPDVERVETDIRLSGVWDLPEVEVPGDIDGCIGPAVPTWHDSGGEVVGHYGAWGRDSGFVAEDIVGRWAITIGDLYVSTDANAGPIQSIVEAYATFTLEVLEAGDGTADIRILADTADGACVVLDDTADLSATGELTWSKERVDVPTDPEPLILYAPTFRLGFDADAVEARGGELSVVIDTRATSGTDFDLCDVAAYTGGSCVECDDGEDVCLGLAGFRWTATKTAGEPGEDLPLCGADFSDTGVVPDFPDITCEPTGALCVAAWMVPLVPLLRRRRAASAE